MQSIMAKWLHKAHRMRATHTRRDPTPAQPGAVEWMVQNAEEKARHGSSLEEKSAIAIASFIHDVNKHQPWGKQFCTEMAVLFSGATTLANDLIIDNETKMIAGMQKANADGKLTEDQLTQRIHSAIRFDQATQKRMHQPGPDLYRRGQRPGQERG